jgi:PhnB protein
VPPSPVAAAERTGTDSSPQIRAVALAPRRVARVNLTRYGNRVWRYSVAIWWGGFAERVRAPRVGYMTDVEEAAMSPSYKPSGHNSVSPYLIVDGADRTISFLKAAFGAVELFRYSDDDGAVVHAEVRIDDSVIMLADGGDGHPPGASHVHVYVPDVDATYRKALEAGAAVVQAPVKKQDSDKRGGVKDGGGTTWWIGTKLE